VKNKLKYKRVVLKISGEALKGKGSDSLNADFLTYLARQIKELNKMGVELAIVVGGGNICRGLEEDAKGIDRSTADYMGMLATCINALALQERLEREGVATRLQSAIEMNKIAEPYIKRRAVRHLEKGRVVILAAGTGNPFFSTDTAAALRASEIGAEVIFKATRVDGVYSDDPLKNPKAKLYRHISYMDAIRKRLKIMDATALSLCMENKIPIVVFNIKRDGDIKRLCLGEHIGTLVQ
jgi:uridylate kinase